MDTEKITLHWTAGRYEPNKCDLANYHILIKEDGSFVKTHQFSETLEYSCYMENTDNIQISLCGMLGANPDDFGEYPITKKQIEAMIELCAVIVLMRGIKYWKIKTHAERAIEKDYFPIKWDFACLRPCRQVSKLTAIETGRNLRKRILYRISELNGNDIKNHPLYYKLTKGV